MVAQARLSMIEEHFSSTCLEPLGVGVLFQRAREDRGLSIDAVANILHIRECYLSAIEGDHIDELPREFVYWSGFIRTYAQFLDLDGQEIIRQIERNRSYSVKSADEKINCYVSHTDSNVSKVQPYILLISGMIAGVILFLGAFIFKYLGTSKQSINSELMIIEEPLTTSYELYKEGSSPLFLGPINYKQTMLPVIKTIKTKKIKSIQRPRF